MQLLLDTHVFLWWLSDHPRLSTHCRSVIARPDSEVLISAASIWEMAIKMRLGKLSIQEELQGVLDALIDRAGFSELHVTARHAAAVARLPVHHSDPFDRLLVAQALEEGCTLVTADRALVSYPAPLLLADT